MVIYERTFCMDYITQVSMHWHDEMQFIFVVNGSVEYKNHDDSFILTNGNGLFISSGCIHSITMHNDNPSTYLCFMFDKRIVSSFQGSAVQQKYIDKYARSVALSTIFLIIVQFGNQKY